MDRIKDVKYVKEEVKKYLRQYLELRGVKIRGRNFRCFIPGHIDEKASAGLTDDLQGFKCLGCNQKGDIFTAYSIFEGKSIEGIEFYNALKELSDMFNIPYELEANNRNVKEAEYIYKNEMGREIYKIERFYKEDQNGNIIFKPNGKKDKTFRAFTRENEKWVYGMHSENRYLYNLEEITKAIEKDEYIYFVEGEKCAEIIKNKFGLTTTTIPFGSSSWCEPYKHNYIKQLEGSKVILLPDYDKSGIEFMDAVGDDLKDAVKSLKVIKLSEDTDLPEKGDIEEWIKGGGNKAKFLRLVEDSKDLKENFNWYEKDEKGKLKVNTGLLARYLVENHPAIYCEDILYIYQNGLYKKCGQYELQSVIKEKIDDKLCKMSIIKDVEGQWLIDKRIRKEPEELDSTPEIINIKNGLYNIDNGEFLNHNPEFLSTVQLDVNYNPQAKGEVFIKFLNEIVPKHESQMLLQEIAGYTMTLYNKAKKFFIVYGLRDTGKTTFLNLIMSIISKKYLTHISLQNLDEEFNTGELRGKLANIATELPEKGIHDVAFVKALIGQDSVQGNLKNTQRFYYENKAKLIFACNNLPQNYSDKTDSFYNKMIILQFSNQVSRENMDVMLPEKLVKEKEYVFLWAMEGLKRLINNGFVFTTTEDNDELIEAYKLKSNSVLSFIYECCTLDENREVTSYDLYMAYKEYCKQNNYMAVNKNNFKQEIRDEFKDKVLEKQITDRRLNGYRGISIKEN